MPTTPVEKLPTQPVLTLVIAVLSLIAVGPAQVSVPTAACQRRAAPLVHDHADQDAARNVSVERDAPGSIVTRRQRQLDELRGLCAIGAIGRAIDLAYEHFADFGPIDEITVLIADAMEHVTVADAVRYKFDELLRAQR